MRGIMPAPTYVAKQSNVSFFIVQVSVTILYQYICTHAEKDHPPLQTDKKF